MEGFAWREGRGLCAGFEIRGRGRGCYGPGHESPDREPGVPKSQVPQDASGGGVGFGRFGGCARGRLPLRMCRCPDIRRGRRELQRTGHAVHRGHVSCGGRLDSATIVGGGGEGVADTNDGARAVHRTSAGTGVGHRDSVEGKHGVRRPSQGRRSGAKASRRVLRVCVVVVRHVRGVRGGDRDWGKRKRPRRRERDVRRVHRETTRATRFVLRKAARERQNTQGP
mmetsp:Transcript_208/g.668  ORF Transcript_208/g.668 Transcript_208/m.668 type:complete len:225 (+) Transcript_208:306-980(+)